MFFFFQAEDGIRDYKVTGVQTCALPIFYGGIKNTADSIHVALLTILNITAERISEAFRSLISFTAAVNTGESSITLTSAVSLAVT